MNARKIILTATAAALAVTAAWARTDAGTANPAAVGAASAAHLAVGTITGIDPEQRLMTIEHGDIPSMNMPAMTMQFGLHPSIPIGSLKVGQSITFAIGADSGGMVITAVRPTSTQAAAPGGRPGHANSGTHGMPGMSGMPMMAQCHEMMSRR
jgi:Cu/Ag efflux protein CusF